jgi:PHD/YefM family antitoxin component YafN of YafNO toxin-antitoxin module
LSSGEQQKYVVMRNNSPVAVMLPVEVYETEDRTDGKRETEYL